MTIWYCAVLGYMMSLNIYSSFRMISISSTTARDMLCSPPPQQALTLGSNNIGRTKTPKMSASPTTTKAPCSLQQWIYTYLRKRSEERRVGKECRSRWSPDHDKKKREERCRKQQG